MNRAGSCVADYICVYHAIQCTRSDWERAKQESDSPTLASAETSSTGNGDQRSFCRALLRTEANPPHTVGRGPGSAGAPRRCLQCHCVQSRLGAVPSQEAPASWGEADLSAAGIRFSEPPPLSRWDTRHSPGSLWPPCRALGTGRERLPAVSQSPALGLLHNGHSVNTSSMHEIRLLGKYVVLGLTWQVPTV